MAHDTDQWTSPERSAEVATALPVSTRVTTSLLGIANAGEVVGHRYLPTAQVHFVNVRCDDGTTRSYYPNDVTEAS